jgi:hypothetical protein
MYIYIERESEQRNFGKHHNEIHTFQPHVSDQNKCISFDSETQYFFVTHNSPSKNEEPVNRIQGEIGEIEKGLSIGMKHRSIPCYFRWQAP